MMIHSLGYRTDLALLRMGGSTVDDEGDHLVIRSPHNPRFWWGNFLLLKHNPSTPEEAADRVALFRTSFPDAKYVAVGVDETDGLESQALAEHGLTDSRDTVMVADTVHLPPRPATHAEFRPLLGDEDWAQHVELSLACHPSSAGESEQENRTFVKDTGRINRKRVEERHGVWMGAFVNGRLDSQMGLLDAGDNLARFQSVETRPAARGQGLAGTLTYMTSRHGMGVMGARRLVMVADPAYIAIRVYASVGFVAAATQMRWERAPN